MRAALACLLCLCLARCVWSEDVECPNLRSALVCIRAGLGFRYSDGCNNILCGRGGRALSTLKFCSRAAATDKKCVDLENQVNDRLPERTYCPKLDMSVVCKSAPDGFRYSDGCNGITCEKGSGTTTLMACPEPTTVAQKAACEKKFKAVVESMPLECPEKLTKQICATRGNGFTFSDGCNRVRCTPTGPMTITRKSCPPSTNGSFVCIAVANFTMPKAVGRSVESSGEQFTCSNLRPKVICNRTMSGFRYSDGCNDIVCSYRGRAVSTMMFCESADPTGDFCQRAFSAYQEKLSKSKRHRECLTARDVCTDEERKSYYNGCNYCYCSAVHRASCTRRACLPFFGTDEDFKEECKRRNVGVVSTRDRR